MPIQESPNNPNPPEPSLDKHLAQYLHAALANGFWTHQQALELAVDLCSSDYNGVQERAEAVSQRVLAEREREMATWPEVTDCDRLDAAFEELNSVGILARHNWWCCSSCGAGAIGTEVERLGGTWEGVPIVGYTFYDHQATDGAVEGCALSLSYGICREESNAEVWIPEAIEIGRKVVHVLEKHGLKVHWEGRISRKIAVKMIWQRRSKPERFCEIYGD